MGKRVKAIVLPGAEPKDYAIVTANSQLLHAVFNEAYISAKTASKGAAVL